MQMAQLVIGLTSAIKLRQLLIIILILIMVNIHTAKLLSVKMLTVETPF